MNNSGQPMACTSWRDFALSLDARYGNAQGVVRDAFWVKLYILFYLHFVYKFFSDNIKFAFVETLPCGSR